MSGALCEKLAWDSEFFGVGIGRVIGETLDEAGAAAVDQWCQANRISCLYFMVRADDAMTRRTAEGHGFALVEVRVELERAVKYPPEDAPAGFAVRAPTAADLPALEAIARTSFTDSRFYWDTHFPREQCDELYARWIRESLRGFADAVLVAEYQHVAAAFVTCKLERTVGRISLLGVDARFRGMGLGQSVMRGAMQWFAGQHVQRVVVATQARNIASQRLYQRCGFLTRSVGLYYHKWGIVDL